MTGHTLPFKVGSTYGGLADLAGLIRLEADSVDIEFQVRDGVLGVLRSSIRTVRLPFGQLEEIGFSRGIFGNTLTLRVARMQLLAEIPGVEYGEFKASIARHHCEEALELVRRIRLEAAEHQLQEALEAE